MVFSLWPSAVDCDRLPEDECGVSSGITLLALVIRDSLTQATAGCCFIDGEAADTRRLLFYGDHGWREQIPPVSAAEGQQALSWLWKCCRRPTLGATTQLRVIHRRTRLKVPVRWIHLGEAWWSPHGEFPTLKPYHVIPWWRAAEYPALTGRPTLRT